MIKHTIEVSARPALLKLRHRQLVIISGDGAEAKEASFACEDIGVLILQHPAISLSSALLNALLSHGCVVVICDARHLPSGLLLPTVTHTELVPRMQTQLTAPLPAKKRAWQALVRSKILAQLANLPQEDETSRVRARLLRLADTVKSGDPQNHEAQAAKLYWRTYFPEIYASGDQRHPEGASLFNSALNYGYAILRAAVARAILSSGLQPALGVHHHHRSNPFCLADDLMEPLRPMVDAIVRQQILSDPDLRCSHELTRAHRQPLLKILTQEVEFDGFYGPLQVALSRYTSLFLRYLSKESNKWVVPTPLKETC